MQGPLDLAAYQQACEAQRRKNERLLTDFETTLTYEGLPTREAQQYLSDIRLFLDGYLLRQDDNALDMGCYLVDDFVEEFLVAQGDTTPDDVDRICTALLRFYGHLLGEAHIEEEDYEELDATIDAQLAEWKQACLYRVVSRPPAEMRDVVTLSMPPAGEQAGMQSVIDRVMLMLLYLLEHESGEDAKAQAIDRLQAAGLVVHDASSGKNRPTHQGIERAKRDLAALSFDR